MPQGKYFYIRAKLNDLVLDVKGGECRDGDRVVTFPKKDVDAAANQLWFEDHVTGTIRVKQNPKACLEINDDNTLIINEYDKGKDSQKWQTRGDFVVSRHDDGRVLDVARGDTDELTRICAWNKHGRHNQMFDFDHVPAQYFYIKSQMNGKVVSVKDADSSPGAKIVMHDKEDDVADHQLWYENRFGAICTKLNDFAVDASDGEGKSVTAQPFDHDAHGRLWSLFNDSIVNQLNPNMALDIKKKKDKNGAKIISRERCGDDNQLWEIELLD